MCEMRNKDIQKMEHEVNLYDNIVQNGNPEIPQRVSIAQKDVIDY